MREEEAMSEEAVIVHGSPTLAGIKTGSLFRYPYETEEQMCKALRRWNVRFRKKGLRVIPLLYREHKALLYLYRPARLCLDLQNETASRILDERGYCTNSPERCIIRLMNRLQESEAFPHEIGLFLGYPAEDVQGFLEHRDRGVKCVGCWKVYGDEALAKRTFEQYRKCSEIYRRQWRNGTPIDRLTVAQSIRQKVLP